MAMIEAATSQTCVSPNSSITLPLHAPSAIEPYLAPLPSWTESERAQARMCSASTFSSFRRGRRFCVEGEPAEYIYWIVEGVAEGYHITSEGCRQIISFYAAGDIFGMEAGSDYTIFVDAITSGRIQIIKRTVVNQMIAGDAAALQELLLALARGNQRSKEHILRLRLPATERVGEFILDMCDRLSGRDDCHLPMTRQEIGDHLGLTIETVSRTLTRLRRMGIISLSGCRDIIVIDRKRLRRLTR